MNEEKLFNYLDTYQFSDICEIIGAIEDYDREIVQMDEDFQADYSALAEYSVLAEKYMASRKIKEKIWYLKTQDEQWKIHRHKYLYLEY